VSDVYEWRVCCRGDVYRNVVAVVGTVASPGYLCECCGEEVEVEVEPWASGVDACRNGCLGQYCGIVICTCLVLAMLIPYCKVVV